MVRLVKTTKFIYYICKYKFGRLVSMSKQGGWTKHVEGKSN